MPSSSKKLKYTFTIRIHKDVTKYTDIIKPEILSSPEWGQYTKTNIDSKYGTGKIFLSPAQPNTPEWKGLLATLSKNVAQASDNVYSKALIIFRLKNSHTHRFASISIGYGDSIIDRKTVVNDFGKVVAAKTIKDDKMRAVDTTEITDVILQSSRQIVGAKINGTRSILGSRSEFPRSIRGTIKNGSTEIELVGNNDSLKVTRLMSLDEIAGDLDFYVEAYENKNLPQAEWSTRFSEVKDTTLKNTLFLEFANSVLAGNDFAIAWPYLTEDADYKITGIQKNDEIIQGDLATAYKDAIGKKAYTSKQLVDKFHRDSLIKVNVNQVLMSVKIVKSLIGDLVFQNERYLLFNGTWFLVSSNFFKDIKDEFDNVVISCLPFIPTKNGESEENYNGMLNISLNRNNFPCREIHPDLFRDPTFARSGVEPADLVTENLEFIYIKKGTSSANLSHLFLQGQVAASLISANIDMRKFVAKKGFGSHWLNDTTRKNDIKIVFGIIKKNHDLPFFSMISFVEVIRNIKNMDFQVQLAWIDGQ